MMPPRLALHFFFESGPHESGLSTRWLPSGSRGILRVWIAPAPPRWLRELHANHVTVSNVGGTSDPALSGVTSGNVGSIIDLQAALSVFGKDPHFYNWGSYLIIGPLILIWSVAAVGRRVTLEQAQLAIAAIAVLSLLPIYHRPYDAKLLMLTIPACAMCPEGGARRWLSLCTVTGIFLTSDIPLALFVSYSKTLFHSASIPADKAVIASLLPPLGLLATGIFYLVAYIRYSPKLSFHIHDHMANGPIVASTNGVTERSNQDWERAGLTAWAVNRE
jgi:hypothetical protein